jgi:hypothetical protein
LSGLINRQLGTARNDARLLCDEIEVHSELRFLGGEEPPQDTQFNSRLGWGKAPREVVQVLGELFVNVSLHIGLL